MKGLSSGKFPILAGLNLIKFRQDGFGQTSSCRRQAFFRQFKDRFNLATTYSGKPCNEIVHTGAILKIFKQRLYRHASPFENPGSPHHVRMALNFRALVPIEHAFIRNCALDKQSVGSELGICIRSPPVNIARKKFLRARHTLRAHNQWRINQEEIVPPKYSFFT